MFPKSRTRTGSHGCATTDTYVLESATAGVVAVTTYCAGCWGPLSVSYTAQDVNAGW